MTELTPHMHLPVASDLFHSTASSGSAVNIPPARQGMHLDKGSILGLGRSAGEGVAIHSSILAWRISRTEVHGGHTESDTTKATEHSLTHNLSCFEKVLGLNIPQSVANEVSFFGKRF